MPSESEYPKSSALVGAAESVWEGSESRVTICISASEKLRAEMEGSFGLALESVFITDSGVPRADLQIPLGQRPKRPRRRRNRSIRAWKTREVQACKFKRNRLESLNSWTGL